MKVPYQILYNKIVDADCKLPALRGVKFFGEWAVASDNYILIAIKSNFPESFKGWTLDKDEEKVREPFPATLNTIQFDPKEVNLVAYQDKLKEACLLVPESPDEDRKRFCIEAGGFNFYPPRILKALSIFESAGETPDAFTRSSKGEIVNPTLILRSPNCIAFIAAVDLPADHDYSLTITEAIELGELL